MTKLFFALMACGLLLSANSCKKCGYCRDASGQNGSAVCKKATLSALGVDDYKEAETNCHANGGTWIVE